MVNIPLKVLGNAVFDIHTSTLSLISMERQKTHFIQSLARGLSILQAFSSERPKLTLTQLSSLTNLNVVAVQRYTDTLINLGYLRRSKHKEGRGSIGVDDTNPP